MISNKYILIFLGLAVLILWQMLLPGYVLTLDMVFTPEMKVLAGGHSGLLNFLPVSYLISFFNLIISGWVIQKIILLVLFFNLGYLSFRYLPLLKNNATRFFAALIYMANPFVYSRFLAGHWTHLMAYSFLPMFVHFLFGFTKKPSFKSCFKLFGTLFLISVFSVHFFVMSAMVMVGWFLWSGVARVKPAMTKIAICGLLFLVASSYWMIPAMNRNEPIEGRFGVEHWEAFSASGCDGVNVLLNVLSLNGFWGEGEPWAKYFSWPQDYIVFWLAFSFVLIFVLIGALGGLRFRAIRSKVIFFSCLGVFAFIFSTGAAETIFKELNVWLYNNIFFWSGFRDSQKFSGFLALSYSVLAGVGLAAVIDFLNKRKLSRVNVVYSFVLLIPVLFGFLIWGGFQKQLRPVWYPENWHKAKQIIEADNSNSNVLFLPWHGYLSLGFNNNLITANPARRFFGKRAIVSRSVELGEVYGQETETGYKELDRIIKDEADLSADETIDFFIGYSKIGYIVYFLDLEETDNLRYEFLNSAKLEKVFADESVEIYLTAID